MLTFQYYRIGESKLPLRSQRMIPTRMRWQLDNNYQMTSGEEKCKKAALKKTFDVLNIEQRMRR